MADDGSDLQFCTTCAFSHACLSQGMDKSALMDLHVLVEHVGPYHAGDVLFREGDPFEAIAAVRAGTVKTCVTDRDGHEHVLGFHFPGEVIGLNAIDGHRYPCDAVALDTVMLCRFSFPKISVLAARVPGPAARTVPPAQPRHRPRRACWPATGPRTSASPPSWWACRGDWPRAGSRPAASS